MSLPQKPIYVIAALCAALALAFGLAEQAAAQEPPLASIRAPFECGTEWSGSTRSGHGLNDWNLDVNRTSRTFAEPQHDLGQPLIAQADGTVVWIGLHYSAGTYVEIDYGDITARYIHVVHDSVPIELEVGSELVEGQLFGLLGDTGNATHAHLHLEYFDSRDYDDARAWLLPDANQIQITMDGVPIEPGDAFTSTNCDGEPPLPTSTTTSSTSTTTTTTTTTATTPTTTTTAPPHPFLDVEGDSYAYLDVALLYDLAITTGTADTSFSPGETVTREQMAAFLGRIWLLFNPTEPPLQPAPGSDAEAAESTEPDGFDTDLVEYPFDDVDPDSYAYEHIAKLYELGITTGTGPTSYSPNDEVDREQMAAFLNRLHDVLIAPEPRLVPADLPDPAPVPTPLFPFTDVRDDSFARAHIEDIWRLGITTGTSPDAYSPTHEVDREQMAAFLARLIRLFDEAPEDDEVAEA